MALLSITRRFFKTWPVIKPPNDFLPPNKEDRVLPAIRAIPVNPANTEEPMKYPKRWYEMRGPERIHNQLIYKQYGLIALSGGAILANHMEHIRNTINKNIDTDRMFAVWRIDPPWKAVSRKGLGKKRGGGKGKVHHYETPIKAGRIIIEIGGTLQYEEIKKCLDGLCCTLPFDSMPISQELIDDLVKEKQKIESENQNPFQFRYLVRNNYSDALRQKGIDKYEALWGGQYF